MKNYFPMKTFHEDAVVRRLNVLYKLLKDVDVEYDEEAATFTFDGDLTVTGAINGEENPSVKPIYCHPIYLSVNRDGTRLITFTCLIFNNDGTPFTVNTFFDWCIELFTNHPDASVMASGYSSIYPVSRIKRHDSSPTNVISIESVNSSGTENDFWSLNKTQLENSTFVDGVNKIN